MATFNLSWTPGGSVGTQQVKYKVASDPTYTPFATVAASVSSIAITGLLDNVLYDFLIEHDCADCQNSSIQIQNIKFTCPTVSISSSTNEISFPPLGGTISSYIIQLFNAAGTNPPLQTYTVNAPFTNPVRHTFTGLSAVNSYKIRVVPVSGTFSKTDCPFTAFNVCNCPTGFTITTDGTRCQMVELSPVQLLYSDYCLAASTNISYSNYGTRIYNPGFTYDSVSNPTPPSSEIFAIMTLSGQWSNPSGNSSVIGPMNRAGVWIDSDCNGSPNILALGAQTTLAYSYNNTGAPRTVYVGVGGDNYFSLRVNGIIVAQTTGPALSPINFKTWHIVPVTIVTGTNDFNAVGTGDGFQQDSIAMVVYDNTPAQIRDATADSQLNILFTTFNLRNQHIDVATCQPGYSLDTSGGVGNYICRRITNAPCAAGGASTFTADWMYSLTNPYPALQTADNLSYANHATFNTGDSIITDVHTFPDDIYLVVRYPASEPDALTWFESSFNNGSVAPPNGDSVFRGVFTANGFKYLVTRTPATFSHSSAARITFAH